MTVRTNMKTAVEISVSSARRSCIRRMNVNANNAVHRSALRIHEIVRRTESTTLGQVEPSSHPNGHCGRGQLEWTMASFKYFAPTSAPKKRPWELPLARLDLDPLARLPRNLFGAVAGRTYLRPASCFLNQIYHLRAKLMWNVTPWGVVYKAAADWVWWASCWNAKG